MFKIRIGSQSGRPSLKISSDQLKVEFTTITEECLDYLVLRSNRARLVTTGHIPLSPQTQQLTGLKFKMAEGEQHIHGRRNIRIILHLALDVGGVEFNFKKKRNLGSY